MTIQLSRLSDLQIADDVIRSYLYREILTGITTSNVKTTQYEIKGDEMYRPDLVSFRVYGHTELRWLVCLLCSVEDEEEPLPVSSVISFPDPTYIRDLIRHYAESGEL
ncbi:baseplate wedge protein 53 [Shewanella algae]|uniref:baseplate wedge protein 53 n=1 Tax=Shewanella TaxID=22 RepID=UPI0031F5C364